MTYAYDEATLDLLRLTIPIYGILVPIIRRSGTNEVIDGRHRLKIREELQAQGTQIMLPVHHVDTNNPEEIDQIVNSVRRPWQDAEQRRELVSKLREKGHSHQRIADAVGTHKKTVQNDLKAKVPAGEKAPVSTAKPKATTGKDGKTKLPPATPKEIARAWAMLDAGKNKKEIAAELERGYSTVREWFNKERPEAVQQGQPTPTPTPAPTPAPTPTPSVPSAGSSTARPERWADHPLIEGWTGKLSEVGTAIYKRESISSRKRVKIANQLAEFKADLERTMRAASNDHKKGGGKILEADVIMVEATLQQEKHPGITETLESVMNEAERIHRFASRALEIFQMKEVSLKRLS